MKDCGSEIIELRSITLYCIEMELRREFETSFGKSLKLPKILVKVIDSSGEEGWGEVVAGEGPWYSYETWETALLILEKYLVPQILGKRELRPRNAWSMMRSVRGHNMAKAGLEMALWDLGAKLARKPLYEYVGGVRDYAVSGVSLGIRSSIGELVAEVGSRIEEGYARIKVKIKPGWDYEVLRALRRAYPDVLLQADANGAYTLRDLPTLLKLDKFELLMLEQPLAYDDLVDHAVLSRKMRTPICLDESINSMSSLKAAYALGSCEILNLKPGRVGGYTPSLEIAHFAAQCGIGVWIGGMLESGVGRGHLVALATLDCINYPNDISASNRYWREDIVEPPWTLQDGKIMAPRKPGIGVEVVEKRVEKLCKKRRELRGR